MKTRTSYKKGHKPTYTKKGKEHCRYRHGKYGTPIYKKWMAMKRRCLNPNDTAYSRYGGRGIKICDKWLDFIGFNEDVGDSFIQGMSLERIDSAGNYCKKNCRWIPINQQSRNRRSVVLHTFNGKTLTLGEWSKEIGIKTETLRGRLMRYGWTLEETLTIKPSYSNHKY